MPQISAETVLSDESQKDFADNAARQRKIYESPAAAGRDEPLVSQRVAACALWVVDVSSQLDIEDSARPRNYNPTKQPMK
ncbi:hypothetical protein PM082_016314 [Marasmius tenuissimus]|nr:hypothetical protein PM082_016314 [Marasmius tenuissimus]